MAVTGPTRSWAQWLPAPVRGLRLPGLGSRAPRRLALRASAPAAVLAASAGTLLIAVGYADGRSHETWAAIPFWAGWIVSFLAFAGSLISAGLSTRGRVIVLLTQAAQQSIVRWMYSPLSFTFPDELQHWRTGVDILGFHHLFHANPTLPVSPAFPGLEELATSLVNLARICLFPAGLIVVSVAHVALSGAVFLIYRRVTGSDRVAALATFLFALNPLHAGFDTAFIYEGPAVLFGAVVLDLALSEPVADNRWRVSTDVVLAMIALGALIVAHHLTAAIIIAALGVLGALVAILGGFDAQARRLLGLFCAGLILASAWVAAEAPGVVSYLGQPLLDALHGLLHAGHVAGRQNIPKNPGGSPQLIFAGTLVTAVLVAVGGLLVWRRGRGRAQHRLALAFAICAAGYYGVLLVRLFAPDGAELAGRLLTFAALFTSPTIAVALVPPYAVRAGLRRYVRPVALVAMLVMLLGGMMSGWPAPWEILPGTFHAGAFESGIDRQNMAAVQWFEANIGPGKRVACDFSSATLLGAYAGANPIDDAGALYYAPHVDAQVQATIHRRDIQYLFVDDRMSDAKPIDGSFFHETNAQAADEDARIPLAALLKFRGAPGFQLIYDSGPIQIYDLAEIDHA